MCVTHNYPYEGNTLPGHITQDEKLDLIMFASVENMIQIHVLANVAFTPMYAMGVNMYLHHIYHTGKHEQFHFSCSVTVLCH